MVIELSLCDYPRLEALEAQAQSGASERLLADALTSGDGYVLGCFQQETLVGYALLARLPFEAELQAIGVLPGCRHQGVGGTLMQAVLKKASEWQSERLLLEVRAGNQAAIALYRRFGFTQDGLRKGYYPAVASTAGREDALLMSRVLD
ncbi:ribosomal protein S18-alanine N-acetyltransferase [Halomonas aquamarina]|uniref:Ribosomal protein S18-alanine N-acetyltransferase n=1 Tax=Vreelandella aquamarina TaxID=77097 RepID=A0ACC5VRT6_9GAMM|nr:ribosomal protein S18-alanine N-acetyltransferase [Halomonas aquamarina]MBZ5487008.1 ribosomal protein S18-alanine N-acetyltransferase [Halomonas aquamarina]